MDCCFPAQLDSTGAVYFMRQCRGKPKYSVYPVIAGLRKEMSGKKYTTRDDFKLNKHGD